MASRNAQDGAPLGSELGRNADGELYFSCMFHPDEPTGTKQKFWRVNVEMSGEAWLREHGFNEGDRICHEQISHLREHKWLYTSNGTVAPFAKRARPTPRSAKVGKQAILATTSASDQRKLSVTELLPTQHPYSAALRPATSTGNRRSKPKNPFRAAEPELAKIPLNEVKPFWKSSPRKAPMPQTAGATRIFPLAPAKPQGSPKSAPEIPAKTPNAPSPDLNAIATPQTEIAAIKRVTVGSMRSAPTLPRQPSLPASQPSSAFASNSMSSHLRMTPRSTQSRATESVAPEFVAIEPDAANYIKGIPAADAHQQVTQSHGHIDTSTKSSSAIPERRMKRTWQAIKQVLKELLY